MIAIGILFSSHSVDESRVACMVHAESMASRRQVALTKSSAAQQIGRHRSQDV